MWRYVFRRIIGWIPVFVGAVFVVFMVLYWLGGTDGFGIFPLGRDVSPEVIHELREIHGLNYPILIHFFNYITGVLRGDFGVSFTRNVNVTVEVMSRFPYTVWLGVLALLSSFVLAVPIGVLAAVKRNTWIDKLIRAIAPLGMSIPIMGLGLFLIVYFSLSLNWIPASGHRPSRGIITLTVVTLGISMFFLMVNAIRVSLIEVGGRCYIPTIYKGTVGYKMAFRNALVPTLSVLRTHLGAFFTGIILVEVVFAHPGIGRLIVLSILAMDYPMILGCIVMFVICYAILNILIDTAQALIEPRLRERDTRFVN